MDTIKYAVYVISGAIAAYFLLELDKVLYFTSLFYLVARFSYIH